METFIEKIDNNTVRVLFYKEFFQKEAIFSAAYKMEDRFYIKIEPFENDRVAVIMLKKKDQNFNDIENALKEFCNEAIDQQIRLDIEVRTNAIRDSIYKKTFQPIYLQKEKESI